MCILNLKGDSMNGIEILNLIIEKNKQIEYLKNENKKIIALALIGAMSCSALAGCSQGKVAEKDGKVYVYDGTWPEESAVDGVDDGGN